MHVCILWLTVFHTFEHVAAFPLSPFKNVQQCLNVKQIHLFLCTEFRLTAEPIEYADDKK